MSLSERDLWWMKKGAQGLRMQYYDHEEKIEALPASILNRMSENCPPPPEAAEVERLRGLLREVDKEGFIPWPIRKRIREALEPKP